jgi:nucleoid-associated protein YgaU
MSIDVQQPRSYDLVTDQIQIAGVAGGAFEASFNFRIHEGHDEAISTKYYGSGNYYHRLVAANPQTITNPNLIHPGELIRVPQA